MRRPGPLLRDGGVEFSLVSRNATAVRVCLYDEAGAETERVALDRVDATRFAGFVSGLRAGQRYGLRVEGPWDPAAGHRFDPAKLLLDPYATRLDGAYAYDPRLAQRGLDSAALVPKAIIEAPAAPEPRLTSARTATSGLIYEVSVRAFTRLHPDVPEAKRGTVAALAEPALLDHLVRLGVGTVELMPLTAFIDERHLPPLGLSNAWGYNPVSFFAPDPRLAPGGHEEIRSTVAALHAAGIRVVLDVVFNHTGESDALGPNLSLKGLDQALYFRLAADGTLVNDTGCGNTLALDRRETVALVMDSLRAWADLGVDGFRYDLGTVLGRRADRFDAEAPLILAIAQDPQLRDLIHISEPWDVGPGGYQLGAFPAPFAEWNDRFRDDIRLFWRGDGHRVPALATRLAGSSDIFAASARPPSASVNFVAAHDGFTLADLVAYADKHNDANGEGNRDGGNENFSWNNGVEGPTDNADIRARRTRDVRALLATLFVAKGTPMLTAGDEFGRTQQGNNNGYAQDNATTWLDWDHADQDLAGFVAELSRLRARHPALTDDHWLTEADAVWHAEGGPMQGQDWNDPNRRLVGLELTGPGPDGAHDHVFVVLNAGGDARVALPEPKVAGWTVELATSDGAERDGDAVRIPARSIVVLADVAHGAPSARTGVPDAVTTEMAAAHGIARDWWEISGRWHRVPVDSLRAILAGLGVPADTAADVAATRARLNARRRRPIPATTVIGPNTPNLTLTLPHRRRPARVALHLEVDGVAEERIVTVADLAPTAEVTVDGERYETFAIELTDLPPGRHRLRVGEATGALIVSPGRAFLPDDLAAGGKAFGLAAHLYTLADWRRAGLGDLETLARFGEAAGKLGARLVGINPLHHLFPVDRRRVSPYQPSDRRFIDPLYIDVAGAAALFGVEISTRPPPTVAPLIDYDAVWAAQEPALRHLFAAIANKPKLQAELDAFIVAGGAALADHALFETIVHRHETLDRAGWSAGLAARDPAALAGFGRDNADEVRFRFFLQWLADRELTTAQSRAHAAGCDIGVYRDLAIGTAFDGGETWADPQAFVSGVSVGAPPDPFSAEGQVWGLPPMNPLALIERGLTGWSDIAAANMRHAGALRIDHILGFARLFFVPDGATGREGAYVAMPRDALIATTALASQAAKCIVIGEDLGTAEPGLTPALARAGILSSRVLWFDRDGLAFTDPASHPHAAAASLSTHDLPTFAGWRAGRDIAIDLQLGRGDTPETERRATRAAESVALAAAADVPSLDGPDAVIGVHKLLARSGAALVLAQVDDLVGITEPLNVPGTDTEWPNWRRRVAAPIEDLATTPTAAAVAKTLSRR
jgi:glycogen operon protein